MCALFVVVLSRAVMYRIFRKICFKITYYTTVLCTLYDFGVKLVCLCKTCHTSCTVVVCRIFRMYFMKCIFMKMGMSVYSLDQAIYQEMIYTVLLPASRNMQGFKCLRTFLTKQDDDGVYIAAIMAAEAYSS